MPTPHIAAAIESRDTRTLQGLKGIGKRTAELIVAELAGKLKNFAAGASRAGPAPSRRPAAEEDAIQGLMSLGEPRPIAERLLDRVKEAEPTLKSSEMFLREMLRLRSA